MYSFKHIVAYWVSCLLLAGSPATAQLPQYQLSQVSAQGGLKTSEILNMDFDRHGNMWLASQSMVQRFDGRTTVSYTFSETVHQVLATKTNSVWVRTPTKVYALLNEYKGFGEIPIDRPLEGRVLKLFEDDKGSLLLFTRFGFYRFHKERRMFLADSTMPWAKDNPFTGYFDLLGPSIMYGSADSLYNFSLDSKLVTGLPFSPKQFSLAVSRNEALVSTLRFETFYVNFSQRKREPLNLPVTNDAQWVIFSGVPWRAGYFLLSTSKGLFEWAVETRTLSKPVFYFNGEPLANEQSIRYLHHDEAGNTFIAHADGLYMFSPAQNSIQYLRNFRSEKGSLEENDIRHFAEDDEGYLWMATTGGVLRMKRNTGETTMYNQYLPGGLDYPSYRQLLHDGNKLWMGSSGDGVWMMNKTTGKYSRPQPLDTTNSLALTERFNNTYVWKILLLRSGFCWIAGGSRSFLLDPSAGRYQPLSFASEHLSSRSAAQDSAGRLWHGTSQGLWCYDSSFHLLFSLLDSFPDKRIAALAEWKKDNMLVGTRGLYRIRMENNSIRYFERSKSIPAQRFIYCMQQDFQGFVWLGTDDGIFKYDPVADSALYFDVSDQVQSQAFNSDGAFMSQSGMMYMGGRNGINYFYPERVNRRPTMLHPRVSSFIIAGNDSIWHNTPEPFTITYLERNIDFTISAPEFIKPFAVRYRYKLHLADTVWVNNDYSNRVLINNLTPGRYQLMVSASLDGVVWQDAPEPVLFSVAPPWWATIFARSLMIVTGVLLMIVIWWYRKRRGQRLEMEAALRYFKMAGHTNEGAEEILWDIARNCISRMGFEDCVVYLVDEERNMLVQKAAYGNKSPVAFEIINPIEIPMGKGITGAAAATGETVMVKDTRKDARYILDDSFRLSELAVPLVNNGKVLGVIDSEHSHKGFFTEIHRQTLEQIAAICSARIAGSLAKESMQRARDQLALLHSRITEARFMNLRLQMNPHFLFNILTSIQYLVMSGQSVKAINYLNVFAGFLRAILQYAEVNLVSLADELRILKMYIELESFCLDETFFYDIKIDEDIDEEEALFPFMLLQPFVENSIHHGLMHLPGPKHFFINISSEHDTHLVCVIEDNGVGRQRAAEINAERIVAAGHQSRGIGIVNDRLALLYQTNGQAGSVVYEDLFDNRGHPAGTRVTIKIPVYYNLPA